MIFGGHFWWYPPQIVILACLGGLCPVAKDICIDGRRQERPDVGTLARPHLEYSSSLLCAVLLQSGTLGVR